MTLPSWSLVVWARLLCLRRDRSFDGRGGLGRFDAPEDRAYAAWSGPRISVREILGDAFSASSGLQIVAAIEHLRRGTADRAWIATLGGNEQAGACLVGNPPSAALRSGAPITAA